MAKQQESLFVVAKNDGERKKFVRHEGFQHYWTVDRSDAMEYSKLEVAQGIATKMGGAVEVAA
jgi:hypothetical protein